MGTMLVLYKQEVVELGEVHIQGRLRSWCTCRPVQQCECRAAGPHVLQKQTAEGPLHCSDINAPSGMLKRHMSRLPDQNGPGCLAEDSLSVQFLAQGFGASGSVSQNNQRPFRKAGRASGRASVMKSFLAC